MRAVVPVRTWSGGATAPDAQLGLPVRTALSDDTRIGGPYR
ncbi:hypothetical protein ACFVX6_00395 [Streptomyces sp. NPDC058289]